MAFRSTRRGRASRAYRTKGGINLVWITTKIDDIIADGVPAVLQNLVLPSDWQSAAGFDKCTLMRIRGWLSLVQQSAATAADATGCYLAIHTQDTGVSAASDPSAATFYTTHDTLFTTGLALSTATASASIPPEGTQLDIRVKRRLDSMTDLNLTGTVDADTATPTVHVNGIVRCLLKID